MALRELAQEMAASDQKVAVENLKEAIRLLSDLVKQFPDDANYAEELKETQAVSLSPASAHN